MDAKKCLLYKNFCPGQYTNQAILVLPGNRMEHYINPFRLKDNYKANHTLGPARRQLKSEDFIMADTHEKRNSD